MQVSEGFPRGLHIGALVNEQSHMVEDQINLQYSTSNSAVSYPVVRITSSLPKLLFGK